MTKEEAKYFSEILKAYSEGKTIQCQYTNGMWFDMSGEPNFDNAITRYRIKPEPKYRPYNSAEEFLNAQKEHGPYLQRERYSGFRTPVFVCNTSIRFSDNFDEYTKYEELLEWCKWQDGTPCGILENE